MTFERRDHLDIVRSGQPIRQEPQEIIVGQILTGEAIRRVAEVWERPATPATTPEPGSFAAEMAEMERLLGL